MKYGIYHLDREWARVNNDPLLGVVDADSKEDAVARAKAQWINRNAPTGIIACPLPAKVFQLNDCDWWVDYTLEDAKRNYLKECGVGPEEVEDAFELSNEAMARLKHHGDEDDRRHVPPISFREELARYIKRGDPIPGFFASTEY